MTMGICATAWSEQLEASVRAALPVPRRRAVPTLSLSQFFQSIPERGCRAGLAQKERLATLGKSDACRMDERRKSYLSHAAMM